MRSGIVGLVFVTLLVVGSSSSWSQSCPATTCEGQCTCDASACWQACADSPTPFICRQNCSADYQWCSMYCPPGSSGGGSNNCCWWNTSCQYNSQGQYECVPTTCGQWAPC